MLKRGAERSVRRTSEAGEPAALKRWEPRGAWRALRVRRLARREFELLGRLHALGLPVPRPLALRLGRAGPELASAWVEGVELGQCLSAGADPALAERLGELLARAHQLGLRHTDLHVGNVLVDAAGAPWLVDAGGASLGAALSQSERADALVMVCADLRERTSHAWRARAWRAYRTGLGLAESTREAQAIEALAQERRRDVVRRAQRRWLRDSSSCTQRVGSAGSVLASRDLQLSGNEVLELRPRSNARARRLWLAAVRLCDHGLACARPLLWFQAGEPRVYLGLPRFAEPAVLETVLAELEPKLRDRGLELLPSADLRAWRDEHGRPWVSGVEHPRELRGRAPWR